MGVLYNCGKFCIQVTKVSIIVNSGNHLKVDKNYLNLKSRRDAIEIAVLKNIKL